MDELNPEDAAIFAAFNARTRDDLAGMSPEGRAFLASPMPPQGTPPPPEQSFLGKTGSAIASSAGAVADWVTGENVEFPELQGKGDLPGATAADKAAYQLLVSTTLDDYKLETGIKNIFPDAATKYDKFGNLLVTLDDKDAEGNVVGSSTFYPNARGLDLPTTMQIAGGIGLAAPVKKAIATVATPRLTQGYLGASATAATEGALMEGASKAITGLPYDWSVPAAAGIFGPTFLGLGSLFGKSAGYVMKKYRDNPASVLNPDGSFTEETANYIRGKGLNPDDIQTNLYASWRDLVDQGFIPEEAVTRASTQALPFEVKLTTGQQRSDQGQMLWEDMIAKGVGDTTATAILRQFYDAQISAVEANMKALGTRMGAGTRGESAEVAQRSLRGQRDQARAAANLKYDEARAAQQAFLDPTSATTFADVTLVQALESFSPITTPKTFRLVEELREGLQNGMDVGQIQIRRQQLTNAAKEMGPEGAAAKAAVDSLDGYLDEVVTSNLFNIDRMTGQVTEGLGADNQVRAKESIRLWKDAISTWSGFKQKWETKGILNDLTEKQMRDGELQFKVAPEDAANYIFGVNFLGLQSKRNITRDVQVLKDQLNVFEWNQLRGEVVTKLLDGTLTNASEANQRQVSGVLSTEWAKVRSSNRGLIDTLFSREEQGMISSLANVTGRIANRTQNRSNSGAVIGRMAGAIYGTLGLPVPVAVLEPLITRTVGPLYRAGKAQMSTSGTATAASVRPIIIGGASSAALDPENLETFREVTSDIIEEIPVVDALAPVIAPPPQASVSSEMLRRIPPAPSTRGVPGLGEPANDVAATPAMTPPPSAVAQGPSQSSEMMARLFPFDMA
jgi:hypothetical protein